MEIEPLLKKIELLAPRFGRASDDLAAIVGRGRSADYKGVMQNCRLVLEMLLRAMVTTELKQTPGKAMLDELITKFRQQANAGVIPTNVLAHMGTVQAWGNLSSHDHAGSLKDEGVVVGLEEVATSLNSMVAILSWYDAKYPNPAIPRTGVTEAPRAEKATPYAGSGAVAGAPVAAGTQALPAPPAKGGSRGLVIGAAVLVLGGAAGGGYFMLKGGGGGSRLALDAWYLAAREPAPPLACQSSGSPDKLAAAAVHLSDELPDATKASEGEKALTLLGETMGDPSAERAYLLAKAQLQAGKGAGEALGVATKCEGFAAAENLAGKAALQGKRVAEADAHFGKAIASHPDFVKPRFNRALIRLKEQKVDEAIVLLSAVIADNPSSADGHFFLGLGYEAQGKTAEAKSAYCKAMELGNKLGAERCQR